jgi:hypothetical protein
MGCERGCGLQGFVGFLNSSEARGAHFAMGIQVRVSEARHPPVGLSNLTRSRSFLPALASSGPPDGKDLHGRSEWISAPPARACSKVAAPTTAHLGELKRRDRDPRPQRSDHLWRQRRKPGIRSVGLAVHTKSTASFRTDRNNGVHHPCRQQSTFSFGERIQCRHPGAVRFEPDPVLDR